ncbi:MAG: trypsin-like serine protease [Proteobacteria bacterium]|nr:trypsin-like serine protease [Pseudomonadota bacterium]
MKKTLVLLVSGLFLGCAVGEDNLNVTDEEIVGGTPTAGDPAVVAVYAREPGADRGSLCTGTVIAADVVLTAAHCVFPDLVGADAEFSVLLGHDITDPDTRGPEIPAAAVHYDEQFNPNNLTNGHDIAVVILSERVDIEPVPYRREALPSSFVGDPVRIIGYGLNNGFSQSGAGVKREADVNLNGFDSKLVRTGRFGRNICNGDSGGPVLMEIDGQETIIGVNSFGFIFCLFEASSTRVDTYSDFVDQFIR